MGLLVKWLIERWRQSKRPAAHGPAGAAGASHGPSGPATVRFTSSLALVAWRDLHERVKGRVYRIGTLLSLLAVAAAIVVPVLTRSSSVQRVGVVGSLPAAMRSAIESAAKSVHTTVSIVVEPSAAGAAADLQSNRIDVAVLPGPAIELAQAPASGSSSTTDLLAATLAAVLQEAATIARAHLTPAQSAVLAHPVPVPVTGLKPAPRQTTAHATALYALILVFVLLQQYSAWTLMGVAEEKQSRVAEVLLASVRPVELLGGKVIGIGLAALAQAGAIVAVALVLAKAVGSSLLTGAQPLTIVTFLVWFIVGYALYCWVFAAAGSMAERQSQLQSLTFPLALPLTLGYIVSIIGLSGGSPSAFLKVLAYLPPTAPFAMPTLVALSAATWWQFAISLLLSLASVVLVARAASGIYRRAILRSSGDAKFRDLLRLAVGPSADR